MNYSATKLESRSIKESFDLIVMNLLQKGIFVVKDTEF